MCPHSTRHVSSFCYICVLIILCMCPHTAICVLTATCVLILLHMCPHPAAYVSSYCYLCVSSYCYICVLILLHMSLILLHMCPHTATYVVWRRFVTVLFTWRNKQGARSTQHNTFFFAICCAWTREHLKKYKNAGQCYEKLGMLPEAEAHIRDASRCMRPYVSSVWGLKLLVYEALRQRLTSGTPAGAWGLTFLVYEALSYWCMRP
jgi:hypothetical protein